MPIFDGLLESGPSGGAFVVVPDELVAALGGRSRVRVRGRFGGVELHSSLVAMGGRTCVGVHKAVRLAAGVGFGQTAEVELELDEQPRSLDLPAELSEVLDRDTGFRTAFDAAAPSQRREWVGLVRDAKRAETRRRRAARIADELGMSRGDHEP